MINKITLLGRLGKDVEIKDAAGSQVARSSIATEEKWYDKDKQIQSEVTWHNLVIWGKQAELFAKYLKKGSLVYIEGKQANRMYEKDGEKKYVSEVNVRVFKMLDPKPQDSNSQSAPKTQQPEFNSSEEIPF
jgi:single-strand DNA-binding protein